jgi:cardiolipin synthase
MPAIALPDAVRELIRGDDGADAAAALAEAIASKASSCPPDDLPNQIAADIRDGLTEANRVSLVVTGLGWLGGGVGAIESALLHLIDGAEREVALAVYAMSAGPGRFWTALSRALDGGVRGTLIVDRLTEQDPEMRQWVQSMSERHVGTLRVLDFRGEDDNDHLHAKIVVADRRRAVVGSANLTAHGLLLAHELALLVEGPAAEEIAERLDLLARSRLVTARG